MKIVAISDTHGKHKEIEVPDGDMLIHAGDFTITGTLEEAEEFNTWLGTLPHRHKLVIAGNHDWSFEAKPQEARALITNAIYLEDEAVTLEGIKCYGSPWQPWFWNWAFNLQRGPELAAKWALIPADTDILVTHGPPLGHGDRVCNGELVGCEDLLRRVEVVKPRLHVFGHIHEGAGITFNSHTVFINAVSCNLAYDPVHAPIVYELSLDAADVRA